MNPPAPSAGSEGWYVWSYFIPSDYPQDADPTTNWQIVTQFHDQPNLAAGLCGYMYVYMCGQDCCVFWGWLGCWFAVEEEWLTSIVARVRVGGEQAKAGRSSRRTIRASRSISLTGPRSRVRKEFVYMTKSDTGGYAENRTIRTLLRSNELTTERRGLCHGVGLRDQPPQRHVAVRARRHRKGRINE